jgi:hypothetical protein
MHTHIHVITILIAIIISTRLFYINISRAAHGFIVFDVNYLPSSKLNAQYNIMYICG